MTPERSSGLILRVRPLTDTSLIVHWLCAETGRIGTVAKGARTPKSAFAGKLDTGFEAGFGFQRSPRSDLHPLREVVVHSMNTGLREDYGRLIQWAYGVALLEALTETETPLPEVYEVFLEFLHHLAVSPAQPRTVYALELRLLAVLGLEPDAGSAEESLVRELVDLPWDRLAALQPSAVAVRRLNALLQRAVVMQAGRLPRGRAEALKG